MSNNKWAWIVGIVPVVVNVALAFIDPTCTFSLSLALSLTMGN